MKSSGRWLAAFFALVVSLPTAVTMPTPAIAAVCDPSATFLGSGTSLDPYKISSAGDLKLLSNQVAADGTQSAGVFYELTGDIDLTGCDLAPIGTPTAGNEFQGYFDGAGNSISNYAHSADANRAAGLFAYTSGGAIKSLALDGFHLIGTSDVGALIGQGLNTEVNGITVSGSNILGSQQNIGGVVGSLKDSDNTQLPTFSASSLVVTETFVTGANNVGGAIGSLSDYPQPNQILVRSSTVTQVGTVSGAAIGGIIGLLYLGGSGGELARSAFQGSIQRTELGVTDSFVGGLIGKSLTGTHEFSIRDSYVRGAVLSPAGSTFAGFVGSQDKLSTINTSYVEMSVNDGGSPATPFEASPFAVASQNAFTATDSFVSKSAHSTWTTGEEPSADQEKTTSQLLDVATFASWSVEPSGDVIRAGTSTQTWVVRSDVEEGYPALVWAVELGIGGNVCLPGTYSADGRGPCTEAPAGKFTDSMGSIEPIECPKGTYQAVAGSMACDPAPLGHYVDETGQSAPKKCTEGTFQSDTGQDGCEIPGAGFFATGEAQTEATPCPAGTYKAAASDQPCTKADPGHFVQNVQQVEQTACDYGTYQKLAGQSACTLADPGYFVSSTGQIDQEGCIAGTFQPNPGADSCLPAEAGHFVSLDVRREQTPCEPGTFQDSQGATSCLSAPKGYYATGPAAVDKTPCAAGEYQPLPGKSLCIKADPGHFVKETAQFVQQPCLTGSFQSDYGASECIDAEAGHYVSGDAKREQTPCDPGKFQPLTGKSSCEIVPEGYFTAAPGATEKTPCPAGEFQPMPGQDGCTKAEPGYFVGETASLAQVLCGVGTYQPNEGQSECIDVSVGHFATGDVFREQFPCQYGSFQPLTKQVDCELAPPGRYVPERGATEAIPCSPGSFQPSFGQRDCILAEPGFFVASFGAIEQTACAEGTVSLLGASSCTPPGGGGAGGGGGGGAAPIAVIERITRNPLQQGSGFAFIGSDTGASIGAPQFASSRRQVVLRVGDQEWTIGSEAGFVFRADGGVTLTSGAKLEVSSSGMLPGSQVVVYLSPISDFSSAAFAVQSSALATAQVAGDGRFELSADLVASPGSYLLQISGTDSQNEELTFIFDALVQGDQSLAVWTKRLPGNTQAKLYAKSVVGAGKVQFYLNGKEIAWVRAVDESDPKLRVVTSGPMTGANYLVRTVDLKPGKNVLEIYVDGERLRRTAYSRD